MFVSNLLVRSLQAGSLHPLSDLWLSDTRTAFGPGLHGREVDALVAHMLEDSGNPALGLALGEQGSVSMLHVVSHLMLSCGTLRDALTVLQEYAQLILGGLDFYIEEGDGEAQFGFAGSGTIGSTLQFWADFMLAFSVRLIRLHGGGVRALRIAHARPEYADEYTRIFACPLWFEQNRYGFVLAAESLDRSQPHADPVVESALRAVARRQRGALLDRNALIQGVRHALREEVDLTEVDFERVARTLGTTKQVLRKRLAMVDGHSLAELLDEARCQRALSALRDDQHIDVIAKCLGFSKRSSFHRAFKRWTGKTPNQYRGKRGPRRARGPAASASV